MVLAFGSRGRAVKRNLTNIFLFSKRFIIIYFSLQFRKNEISRRKNSSFIVPPLAWQSVIPDPNAPIRRKVSRFEVITFSDVTATEISGIGTQQSDERSQPETITPNLSSDSLIVTVESDVKVHVINERPEINSLKIDLNISIFIHFIFHRVACLWNKVSECLRKKEKNGRQMKCSRWSSLRKI